MYAGGAPFSQTVFDCRGSNGVVLKGATKGVTVAGEFAGEHFSL